MLIQQNKKIAANLSEVFHDFYLSQFGVSASSWVIVLTEVMTLIVILIALDWILQITLGALIRNLIKLTKLKWDDIFYKNKVFRSLIHLIPISIAFNLNGFLFESYPKFDDVFEKVTGILLVAVFIQIIFRIINAIIEMSQDDDSYTTIGIRTFGQMSKIITIFISVIIGIAVLFNVSFTQILAVLGTLTAVILLIFRDAILGFVSGLQIATSRSVKVGDWISISKYNVEGRVKEINLSIIKIEKFDKTMSTIPTYDLISTEVTNNSFMTLSNTRRIKRSILFDIQSFNFCSDEDLENLKKIDLISDYISIKSKEIKEHNEANVINKDLIINGRRLTNIGVFRKYAENYLLNHPKVSKESNLMVRQLEITPQGMPLEIYCFADTSVWTEYEQIQSDIFDHLLSICKYFNLEIIQTIPIKK